MHAWDLSAQNEEAQLRLLELFVKIRRRSLFSFFPQAVVANIVRERATLLRVPAGVAVPMHPPAECLTIVGAGIVGLYASDGSGPKIGEASEGKSLELGAWLAGAAAYSHRWHAETEVELIQIETPAFFDALKHCPDVETYLRRVTGEPAIQRLTKDLRLFGLPFPKIQETVNCLTPLASELPDALLRQGVLAVVVAGEIIVRGSIRGEVKSLGHFSAGDCTFLRHGNKRIDVATAADAMSDLQLEYGDGTRLLYVELGTWCALIGAQKAMAFSTMIDSVAETSKSLESLEAAPVQHNIRPIVNDEEDGLAVADFEMTPVQLKRQRRRRYPSIRQHDAMDCGAAVLATVARYYGKKANTAQFRPLVNVTREGATLSGLATGARAAGFTATGLYSSLKGLKSLQTPFVALMQHHYIVVFEINEQDLVVSDPASGILRLDHKRFTLEFSRNVLALKPNEKFAEFVDSAPAYSKYLSIFSGSYHVLIQIFILSLISFVLGLASPIVSQFMFDSVLMQGRLDLVNRLAIGTLVLGLSTQMIGWLQSYLLTYFTTSVDARFSALFLRHMLKLPMSYYALRQVGDFTSRFGELKKIRNFFSAKPITLLLQASSIVIYAAVIGVYNIWVLAVILGSLPLMLGFIAYVTPRMTANGRLMYKAHTQSSSRLIEHFRNHETIKAIGGEIAARWQYNQTLLETRMLDRGFKQIQAKFTAISGLLGSMISTAVLMTAIYFFLRDELSFGQVMAITGLSAQVITPAVSLLGEWTTFSQIGVSFGRVDDVITEATEQERSGACLELLKVRGEVEFKNVVFQYGADHSPIVLDDVSLKIEAGETVAMVGRSGSGKSTLAFMINRLYHPTKGQVFVDGKDIAEVSVAHLRRQIAVIMQDNNLFSGTILDNITLGDPTPSFEHAMAAAVAADAHGFITKLAKGYSHHLPEGGAGLSGGQRQRITIARALYLDPPILIMDEATSALDALSEQTIVNNIRARQRKRTTVIIAHRLNTIVHADRIVLLDRGRIAELGSHAELMSRQGLYCELFRKQLKL